MSEYLSIANGYGDVNVEGTIPTGYQHIKGKRLQPLCRKLDIHYANALVGWGGTKRFPSPEHDGVVVSLESVPKLLQAIAERDARTEKRRLREAKKQEQLMDQKRAEQRAAFASLFPNALEDTIATYAHSNHVFDSFDAIPIDFLTEEEMADLDLIKGYRSGVLLMDGGNTVVPLFRATLPRTDSSETPEEVHRRAMELGFSTPKVLWAANKLIKMVEIPPQRDVYALKDKLLQHWQEHLVEGRIARAETRDCWHCHGDGSDCRHCDGDGIYSSRTLYESRYQFPGDERVYCYHGYTKPEKLSDEPGADKRSYGFRFTPQDRKSIPFGLHDLIKIMKHELVLLEEAKKQRQHNEMLVRWNAKGLPAIRPDMPETKIRECLNLIDQLTVG